ncbi:hypothetical protein C2R22_06980 [Salinigranum rubrum]|uniref:Gluconate 2-dehydrogenase subunit 3 family protein n=1 Tax=Salinigranum rubrum TaxID=755307 RepID=A0A2I8VK37_9EURY|nr:hypothetical protein [Salinigranum rubrum]AUV81429.1 hypothetical protein C2R22_06980 [Salinigranum rubrum]
MTERPRRADEPQDESAAPTRRQFLTALGGIGIAVASAGDGGQSTAGPVVAERSRWTEAPSSQYHVRVATAVADAVYPPSISVDESFVERRVFGRVEPTPGHFDELLDTIEVVDRYARTRFGSRVPALSPAARRQALQSMGVTAVHPTADGTTAERVRYYLVNDLLFALFTSPKSSERTGVDNPPGYPGGREAYQRPPGGADR